MQIPIYHVDAFTDTLFTGNPAAVCVLPKWLEDSKLQQLAAENNLPVTAFLVREEEDFKIRWFTPEQELDLCGHGTLAAAHVIFEDLEPTWPQIAFASNASTVMVTRQNEWITLNFPSKQVESCAADPLLIQGLGINPQEIYQYKTERYLVVLSTAAEVIALKPQQHILQGLKHRGIVVTAPGTADIDFVSRTFYPAKTTFEDAVTGASHCLLVPYWAERLHKTTFKAQQVSARGGFLQCELRDDRVMLSSKAVLYQEGTIFL